MGRIMTSVSVENLANPDRRIRCDALVDTGASHVVLPSAWRDRLGELEELDTVEHALANQQAIEGVICGPVRIQIEGFRAVYNEVLFLDMAPEDGIYEPLIEAGHGVRSPIAHLHRLITIRVSSPPG